MNKKIKLAQEKFLGQCPFCDQKLKKMDGVNILRCENPNCIGVKTSDGYRPYYRLLNDRKMKAYNRLFKK